MGNFVRLLESPKNDRQQFHGMLPDSVIIEWEQTDNHNISSATLFTISQITKIAEIFHKNRALLI